MPINLQAGQLRNQIRFERLADRVSDEAGGNSAGWIPLFTRWCSLRAVPVNNASGEAVMQGRLTGQAFFTIVVRYDPQTVTLTPDDRATTEMGETLNIRSALDLDGDRRWITIDAQKGVAT
jgi:head-tail adaptor